MQLRLLIVLEPDDAASKVSAYIARACGGAAEFRVVLFIQLPALPAWLEGADSRDVAPHRRQYEAESRDKATTCLAAVRRHLVQNGVSDSVITQEIADASDQVVADILDAAHRHNCDTIVVARHHKSFIREFFEGDFEEKLLRRPRGFTVWLVD